MSFKKGDLVQSTYASSLKGIVVGTDLMPVERLTAPSQGATHGAVPASFFDSSYFDGPYFDVHWFAADLTGDGTRTSLCHVDSLRLLS